jgi:hypothetical protein
MKNLGKLAVIGAALAVSSSFAFADTITLASYGTAANTITNPAAPTNSAVEYQGFNSSSTTPSSSAVGTAFDLNPAGTWANPIGTGAGYTTSPASGPDSVWIGAFATAGPGGTAPAAGYYTFTTTFSATGGSYSGNIDVMADDTTEVLLNGVVLIPFGGGSDGHCFSNPPTCQVEDNTTYTNLLLNSGSNTLTFVVQQTSLNGGGNESSGLDFDGTLTANPAPEPSSLMLLGTGLTGAAGMFFRRRRTA